MLLLALPLELRPLSSDANISEALRFCPAVRGACTASAALGTLLLLVLAAHSARIKVDNEPRMPATSDAAPV